MPKKTPATPDFEACLAELERIVERMEKGEQTLEESLKDFERGIELTRRCQKSLRQAEQRVEQLIEKGGELTMAPFTPKQED